MTQARDPFGLAGLPELQPPSDTWIAISARLHQQSRRRQQWFSGLALAATVTLAIGVVALLPQVDSMPPVALTETVAEQEPMNPNNLAAGSLEPNDIRGQGRSYGNPNLGLENLQSLQRLSQRLEQNLNYLRTGVGAMPAEIVVYQVELEDLVAQVDAAISQQPESSELWRQRVNLLMDLNQIYGAGLRRDEPNLASL